MIISDEIYRDLVHDPDAPFTSPAEISPERTVVDRRPEQEPRPRGWRLGVATAARRRVRVDLRDRLLGIGSEIWSGPRRARAAGRRAWPSVSRRNWADRVALSRRLHGSVARAVAHRFAAAGARCPRRRRPSTCTRTSRRWPTCCSSGTASPATRAWPSVLLDEYGVGVLPGSAFGEDGGRLRLRVATALLYGGTERRAARALNSADPCSLPWIAGALDRLEEVLSRLTG
jgi:aspartate/methionine/tyrosine aminotransferase